MSDRITFRNVPLFAAGSLPPGHPAREQVVDNLAAAIHHSLHVAQMAIWTNTKTGTQHWRDDCPSLRRSKHARGGFIQRQPGMTQPCGMCAVVERDEAIRRERYRGERIVAKLLAVAPPRPLMDMVYGPLALLPRPPLALPRGST